MHYIPMVIAAILTININRAQVALDPVPVIRDERAFVPLRGVFERLGATVDYRNGTIVARRGKTDVMLKLDSPNATINGEVHSVGAQPFVIGSSTYVPLRFVAEALGADVHYDAGTRTIDIYLSASTGEPAAHSPVHAPLTITHSPPPNFNTPTVLWVHGAIEDYGSIVTYGSQRYFVSCESGHRRQPLPPNAIVDDTTANCPSQTSSPFRVANIATIPPNQPRERRIPRATATPTINPKVVGLGKAPPPNVPIRYFEVVAPDGRALDVQGGPSATQSGTIVQVWDYAANSNQQWRLMSENDGTFLIVARNSGLALDASMPSRIVQGPLSGSLAQRWRLLRAGRGVYHILSVANGEYLNVPPGSTNGTLVILTSQPLGAWRLTAVTP